MRPPSSAPLAAIFAILVAVSACGEVHRVGAPDGEKLGTVDFSTSCNAAARPLFNRAVALLHSFEFAQAIEGFSAAEKTDPSCAIAEWGIALSRWGNPFAAGIRPPAQLQRGRDAVSRARTIELATERERAYIDAVALLYVDAETVDQRSRMIAYRDAMARVAETNADDPEASIFYALSLAAAAPPDDKTYTDLLKSAAILETLVVSQPNHPGLSHYIIHSYDVAPLANRALEAAWCYAKIAPSAPHALHMPSHTFTRLGYWQESIDANLASSAVAIRDGSTAEELHALDYLTYAYLQTARDGAAREILDALPDVKTRFNADAVESAAPGAAGVFALAAMSARYALERGAWTDAANLEPAPSRYLYADALTYFAKAIGGARAGDTSVTRSAIESLTSIEARLAEQKESFWAEQTKIQRRAASAWLALAEGRSQEALAEMRAAAALEEATEKSAMTPGPLAPARELVGEMLLQLDQPADALKEFEATLEKEPKRFRAMFGAARAASLAGDQAKARTYSEALLKLNEHAEEPERPELEQARRIALSSR